MRRDKAVDGFEDAAEITRRHPIDPRLAASWRIGRDAGVTSGGTQVTNTFNGAAIPVAAATRTKRARSRWGHLLVGVALGAIVAAAINPPLRQHALTSARGAVAWGERAAATYRAPAANAAARPLVVGTPSTLPAAPATTTKVTAPITGVVTSTGIVSADGTPTVTPPTAAVSASPSAAPATPEPVAANAPATTATAADSAPHTSAPHARSSHGARGNRHAHAAKRPAHVPQRMPTQLPQPL